MEKGAALNKKVWTLFEKAGFATEPNSGSNKEHRVKVSPTKFRKVDLYAADPKLAVTIIGSNKSGGVKDSWSTHVNDWDDLKRNASADTVLFVVTGKELSFEDREYVKQKGLSLWTEDDLNYFGAVADAIGDYAKYEIIHSLGLTTNEEKTTDRVLALRLRQPTSASGKELFLFTICPEKLLRARNKMTS